jgi:hypothetical protein
MIKIDTRDQYDAIDPLLDFLDQIVPFRKVVMDASWDAYSKWDDQWGSCGDCDQPHDDCECDSDEYEEDEEDEEEDEDEDQDAGAI